VLGRRRLGIDDVSAVLPDDAALMAFVQYDHTEWSDSPPRVRTVPSYLAFVLTSRTEAPIVVRLGPTAEIDELVSRMRREVQRPAAGSIGVSRLESDYRVVAGALRRRVWDPLAVHLGKARRVFIVPDGALQLVDFAALPDRADRYLVESGPVIHYLSAERDLVPSPAGRNTEGLLAIGAPAFDDLGSLRPSGRGANALQPAPAASSRAPQRSECGGLEDMRFDPLPATAREVAEIGSLWRNATRQRSGRSTTGAVTELGGAGASELAFKTQSPGKRVLHLATHGFFLDGLCAPARSTAVAPSIAVEMTAYEHPLLVSGLVLAGANQRSQAGASDEDGILTAEEIAGLDLDGVEWAVLSACSTGLGEIKAREGVFGLRRAFQIAGVRTVIMSLWQVDDESTRQWMRALYQRRFTANRSTTDAVRDASLTLLGTRRAEGQNTHPFYWAGFVAAGDWK
jgi:CHAT domain-containing protein